MSTVYPRPSRYRPLPWLRCTIHHQSPASPTVLCLAVQCPLLPRHELCKIYLHKYEKYICTPLCLAPLNKYICEFSSVTMRCEVRGRRSWNKSPFRSYLQTLDINSCKIALLRGRCIDCHLFPVSVSRFTKYYYAEFALQLSTFCHVAGYFVSSQLNLFQHTSSLRFANLLPNPIQNPTRLAHESSIKVKTF